MLLLLVQLVSLVVVPLHAIAHGTAKAPIVSAAPHAAAQDSAVSLSRLFGHDQGFACDDWSAAFSLDSHSGSSMPVVDAVVPQSCLVEGVASADIQTARNGLFLARAPPRT